MKPIAIFFHGLIFLGEPPEFLPAALEIIQEQVGVIKSSGLEEAASEIYIGLNGGIESVEMAELLFPEKYTVIYHGLQCRNECRTIQLIEQWLPGHEDWYVLYLHTKGACHPVGDPLRKHWRNCMMWRLVYNWEQCIADLERGYDAVGCHWQSPPITPVSQYIFAGNFFWAKSNFLITLPSITDRARIKMSGIDAFESRFESEVWIGNGPRIPRVMDYHPRWSMSSSPH